MVSRCSTSSKSEQVIPNLKQKGSGLSLNDIEHVGPVIQSELFSIILNFRMYPYILGRDISKMYSMIWINESDRIDNATIFKSDEFQRFYKSNGIHQSFIAPGHPSTNGQAERYVQILKIKLKCMTSGTIHWNLQEILSRYRITPLADGKTPAEHLYGTIVKLCVQSGTINNENSIEFYGEIIQQILLRVLA